MTNPSLENESNNSASPPSSSTDVLKQKSNYIEVEKLDLNPIPSIPTDIRQNNPIPEKFNADIIVQSTLRKPFVWLLKFPFCYKKPQPQTRRLKPFEIYKFADKYDITLMIIGTLAAIATGVCYSLVLYLYQKVANSLVELGKLHMNTTVNHSSEQWYRLRTQMYKAIQELC